jgi:uncharacterized protein YndB with AHSA1/START domain
MSTCTPAAANSGTNPQTVVTITLTPSGNGTEVTLHHASVPDDDMGRGHRAGWTWYLDALGQRFEKVAAR